MSQGTAMIVDKAGVEMVIDGPCLVGTLEQLASDVGAKPIPQAALTKVRHDALGLLNKCSRRTQTKSRLVRWAWAEAPLLAMLPHWQPRSTGLLYGRVQAERPLQ
jgi:hypothetical protein